MRKLSNSFTRQQLSRIKVLKLNDEKEGIIFKIDSAFMIFAFKDTSSSKNIFTSHSILSNPFERFFKNLSILSLLVPIKRILRLIF